MDQIKIENLEIFANHGVYPEENRLGQKFLVSCILYVDTRKAGKTDDLEASVNYGQNGTNKRKCIKRKDGREELQADRSSSRATCRRNLII